MAPDTIPPRPDGHHYRDEKSPWSEYRELVLKELERLNSTLADIQKDVTGLRTDVALLKFQASAWGVASGAVAGTLVTLGAIMLRSL